MLRETQLILGKREFRSAGLLAESDKNTLAFASILPNSQPSLPPEYLIGGRKRLVVCPKMFELSET